VEIPLIGRFMVKNSIAAVSFTRDLTQQTRNITARAYTVGNLFGSANGTLNQNMHQSISKHRGSFKVSDGATSWLQQELGINIGKMDNDVNTFKSPLMQRLSGGMVRSESQAALPQDGCLTENRLNNLEFTEKGPRPMSAVRSHRTETASHMS